MIYALYFVHVVVCLFLILVVLLQQGKGADLSVFGGGATTVLHKMTVTSFILFILTTLTIGILQTRSTGGSVVSGASRPASSAPASPAPSPAPSR